MSSAPYESREPVLRVVFYRSGSGREPVRECLIDGDTMVLLHGFAKKSRKTPVNDIDTSRRRLARLLEEE